jgi:hypothetical protein
METSSLEDDFAAGGRKDDAGVEFLIAADSPRSLIAGPACHPPGTMP